MLKYIEDVDDKLFKEYSNGKSFNIFINEFHSATNKKDKEKVVKELQDIDNIVYYYIEMNENSEHTSKLIDIANAIIFCMNTLKNGRVIFIGRKQSKIIKKKIFFYCVCIKWF